MVYLRAYYKVKKKNELPGTLEAVFVPGTSISCFPGTPAPLFVPGGVRKHPILHPGY